MRRLAGCEVEDEPDGPKSPKREKQKKGKQVGLDHLARPARLHRATWLCSVSLRGEKMERKIWA